MRPHDGEGLPNNNNCKPGRGGTEKVAKRSNPAQDLEALRDGRTGDPQLNVVGTMCTAYRASASLCLDVPN